MRLILVRHARTILQDKKIIAGSNVDAGLSHPGKLQAKALGPLIAGIPVWFVSPMQRAQETAALAAEAAGTKPKIVTVPALIERDYGEADGKTVPWVMEHYGYFAHDDWDTQFDQAPPDGETLAQVRLRVTDWWRGQDVEEAVVIAHKHVLRMLHHSLTGEDYEPRNAEPMEVIL